MHQHQITQSFAFLPSKKSYVTMYVPPFVLTGSVCCFQAPDIHLLAVEAVQQYLRLRLCRPPRPSVRAAGFRCFNGQQHQ